MNQRQHSQPLPIAVLLFAAVVMALLASCSSAPSLTPASEALAQQVVIRRSAYGVPHIEAQTMAAAGYALGYAQMEDHAERVVQSLLRARGEWALRGKLDDGELASAIDSDALNRLSYQRAQQTWPLLTTDTQDFLSGFAAGINRYIELHPQELAATIEPDFTAIDAHARGIVKARRRSIRDFLEANPAVAGTAFAKRLAVEIPETTVAKAASWQQADVGSNAWALAPERTTSGHAILLRNPHLSWSAGYYEAQLSVPGKFNFYGDFRVGHALGIIGGFNERLGWATTNNAPDLDDVYSFALVDNDPNRYLLDGAAHELIRNRITLEFREQGRLASTERSFWSTPYGPVIGRTDDRIYILKSGGDGEFRTGEQFLRMMKARTLEEWLDAMRMRAKTTSNLTYADADGNIFYVWNATIPDRPHAPLDATDALHVTQSDQMWRDIVTWDRLPQLLNPPGGYLHNENDPFHFANLNALLEPGDYPAHFPEPRLRLRSQLSLELIAGDDKLSLEDVVERKHSMRMLLADRVKDDLIDAVAATDPDEATAAALALLKNWDNTVRRDSRGAVLFETWWNRYLEAAGQEEDNALPESAGFSVAAEKLFREPWTWDRPTETPRGLADSARAVEAFTWAIEETRRQFGHWNVAWGDVYRAEIDDVNVAIGGCPGLLGCFRTMWFNEPDETRERQSRMVRGGDGWVLAVEFGETPRAYSVLAYGQSSRDGSAHRSDQLAMFADNVMKPVLYERTAQPENYLREYRPGLSE